MWSRWRLFVEALPKAEHKEEEMEEGCIFCRIIAGEISSNKALETDRVLAFRDVNPQAPVHVLVVPKKHIRSAFELEEQDAGLLLEMFDVAKKVAHAEGIAAEGTRMVTNIERGAGQSVFHLHIHVLGGRLMGWPPG